MDGWSRSRLKCDYRQMVWRDLILLTSNGYANGNETSLCALSYIVTLNDNEMCMFIMYRTNSLHVSFCLPLTLNKM